MVNRPFHSEYLADICSIRALSDSAMTLSPAPACSLLFTICSVDADFCSSCFMAKLKTIEANSVRSSLSAIVMPVLSQFCSDISTIMHPPKEASNVKYLVWRFLLSTTIIPAFALDRVNGSGNRIIIMCLS